jgi:hypothetical protein
VSHPSPAVTNAGLGPLQASLQEISALRGRVSQLETQKTQLSLSLARQSALLGETNRIKFYHLIPLSTPDGTAHAAPLSPGLQTAVMVALEHELGWSAGDPNPATPAGSNFTPTLVNIGGVDFVDFRPGSHAAAGQPQTPSQGGSSQPAADTTAATTPAQQPPQQPAASQTPPQTEPTAVSSTTPASEPTLPAFVSGNNLVVALDASVVPAGSSVTLTALDANQNATGGSFVLGSNPAVVMIPLSGDATPLYGTSFGWTVSINSISPNGQAVNLQFYAPLTNP